jgi:hypothetical protein
MTTSDRLREQIDCCRPGSSDLALAELAELAAAVQRDRGLAEELAATQQFDARLREALLDVPLPAGLADRLLVAATSQLGGDGAGVVEVKTAPPTWRLDRLMSRRQWLVAGGSLAAGVLLAVSAFKFARRSQPVVTRSELADAAAAWRDLVRASANSWSPSTAPLPKGVTLDPAVTGPVQQWQSFPYASPRGWSATVTALKLSPRAILFALRTSARFDVPAVAAPSMPLSTSGGFQATAWQRAPAALLYVLVVEEQGGQRIEHFLRRDTAA